MRIRFLVPARREFDDVVAEFEAKSTGLGAEFREAVRLSLLRISEFPDAWHLLGPGIRRCFVRRYPYAIIYEHLAAEIIVTAIAHHRREPQYWYSRK